MCVFNEQICFYFELFYGLFMLQMHKRFFFFYDVSVHLE